MKWTKVLGVNRPVCWYGDDSEKRPGCAGCAFSEKKARSAQPDESSCVRRYERFHPEEAA